MFEHMYPAAENTVVGFVTLLAVAEAIGKVRHRMEDPEHKPIMFAFFQGVSVGVLTDMFNDLKHLLIEPCLAYIYRKWYIFIHAHSIQC